MTPIRIIALGAPEPKGSTKTVPLVRKFPVTIHTFKQLLTSVAVTSDNAKLKKWQRLVAGAAKSAMLGDRPIAGPVILEVVFFVVPPQKIPKERGGYPIVRDDVDKLARGILDALSGVAYTDDAVVVDLIARKRYAETPAHARAEILVRPIAIGLPLVDSKEQIA